MMTEMLSDLIASIANLAWPRICEVCGCALVKGEDVICLRCLCEMPMVNLHGESFSLLHQRLAGKVPFDRVGAMFWYYRDTPYAHLIHHAKYNGRPHIGRILARRYAQTLKTDGFFDGIDAIVPIPLSPLKLLRRGYNQSEAIALGLAETSGIKVVNGLSTSHYRATQTRRNAYARWLNARNGFKPNPDKLQGLNHILIVDDVLTTGATILAAAEAIHAYNPSIKLSVFTLAASHLR